MRRLIALGAVGLVVLLIACSNDSGGTDSVPTATCDDNSGACAPQCIPYAVCDSEGSTCVIGGASCGHYWLCHGGTWISDTAEDCDSGVSSSEGGADATVDASADAPIEAAPLDSTAPDAAVDAADAADGEGDDSGDDGPAADGDDAG